VRLRGKASGGFIIDGPADHTHVRRYRAARAGGTVLDRDDLFWREPQEPRCGSYGSGLGLP